jgi:hypothetical protein
MGMAGTEMANEPRRPLPQLMLGLIALAIGLVLAANAIRGGLESRNPRDKIVVAGSSRVPVEADEVTWRLSLTSRQSTAEKTVRELDGWFKRVNAFMTEHDIERDEISISPVQLQRNENSDGEGGNVVEFTATRSLRVESRRLDPIEEMTRSSSELIADGIPIVASSPEFVYTKLSKHRREMIRQAAEDAKKRAETLTKVGGARLGRVRNVEVGNFQVTSRRGTDFESGGTFDRESRHKDISVVVHLTFEIR